MNSHWQIQDASNDFTISDGKIFLPKTPGHGVTVSQYVIKKYKL